MKLKSYALATLTAIVLMSCGKEAKKATDSVKETTKTVVKDVKETTKDVVKDIKEEVTEVVTKKEATAEQLASGKAIYGKLCVACHQANGQGIPGAFPPVAKSDYLNENAERAIEIVLKGKTGEITVNGVKYNSAMTPQPLNSQEIADVLTYVYHSWDNSKTVVTKELVETVKAKL